MKYQANPVVVDAFKIVSVALLGGDAVIPGQYSCVLDNGENDVASAEMCSRYEPGAGDYWVIQSDGYVYLNPKEVFERKYSPLSECDAEQKAA